MRDQYPVGRIELSGCTCSSNNPIWLSQATILTKILPSLRVSTSAGGDASFLQTFLAALYIASCSAVWVFG